MNDSPEIPARSRTSYIPSLCSGRRGKRKKQTETDRQMDRVRQRARETETDRNRLTNGQSETGS